MAGEITRALTQARGINEGEEAVVCTLMHHMSRLLLVFYFPDEWERVEAMCAAHPMTENEAAMEVLGVSLEDIAEAAARKWRLPGLIAHAMKPRTLSNDTVLETHSDWLSAIAHVSAEAAVTMVREGNEASVESLLNTHAKMLGLNPGDVSVAVRQAEALSTSITVSEAATPADGGGACRVSSSSVGSSSGGVACSRGRSGSPVTRAGSCGWRTATSPARGRALPVRASSRTGARR